MPKAWKQGDGHPPKLWAVWVLHEQAFLNRHAHLTNRPHYFDRGSAKEVCNKYARKVGHRVHCILRRFHG